MRLRMSATNPPWARGGRCNGPYADSLPLSDHFQGGGGGGGWVWGGRGAAKKGCQNPAGRGGRGRRKGSGPGGPPVAVGLAKHDGCDGEARLRAAQQMRREPIDRVAKAQLRLRVGPERVQLSARDEGLLPTQRDGRDLLLICQDPRARFKSTAGPPPELALIVAAEEVQLPPGDDRRMQGAQ